MLSSPSSATLIAERPERGRGRVFDTARNGSGPRPTDQHEPARIPRGAPRNDPHSAAPGDPPGACQQERDSGLVRFVLGVGPVQGESLWGGLRAVSAFSSQKLMPISRYIVAAMVRCSCAFA